MAVRAPSFSQNQIHIGGKCEMASTKAVKDSTPDLANLAIEAHGSLERGNQVDMRSGSSKRKVLATAAATVAVFLIVAISLRGHAGSKHAQNEMSAKTDEATQEKIARAMSAGPDNISKSARIIDKDAHGNRVVLREGSDGFTCMPGNPNVVGDPPMCADAPSMQWASDFSAHKPKPANTVPGITYMLAGATQRSDSDPYDKTSPPITVGPHWMIMWPFDPKATGLPVSHRDTGAYIMWAGSPYAHVHVMGHP
jgi:hypothetical protein